jgi:hypothetical protein
LKTPLPSGSCNKLKDRIAQQAAEIVRLRYEDFDTPQGKIVNVTEGGQVVWLNIGTPSWFEGKRSFR